MSKAKNHSINTRLKLLLYKWLMRVYTTPVNFDQISPNISDGCVKCQNGNFYSLLIGVLLKPVYTKDLWHNVTVIFSFCWLYKLCGITQTWTETLKAIINSFTVIPIKAVKSSNKISDTVTVRFRNSFCFIYTSAKWIKKALTLL